MHGNIARACKEIGICRETFYKEIRKNEGFNAAYKDAIDALCDNLEQVMLQSAQELGKGGFMDRIAYLRAHRREKFGDKVQIEHTNEERVKAVAAKIDLYKNAIPAEIVQTPQISDGNAEHPLDKDVSLPE